MLDSLGRVVIRLTVGATLLGWPAPPVAGQQVVYTGTVQVSSGDYIFTERTTSLYFVNGLEVSAGSVRLSGTLPVVSQSTPWVTYGSVPIPSGGAGGGEVARQMGRMSGKGGRTVVILPVPDEGLVHQTGIGDPLVHADVEVVADRGSQPALRFNVSGKIPVTDPDDGFGTGEWDYGAGVSLAKQRGRHSVFVDVAYWRFGDLPDLELKDGVAYGVGYGQVLGTGRWSVLASVSGWTSILDGADPPVRVGLGLSRLLTPGRSLSLIAGVGLTETAPDVSIALGWRLGL
jgi:hypothetical protein